MPERAAVEPDAPVTLRPSCATSDRLWLAYLPDAASGQLVLKGLPPVGWRAAWLDPRTGGEHSLGPVDPGLDLSYRPPTPPSGEEAAMTATEAVDVGATMPDARATLPSPIRGRRHPRRAAPPTAPLWLVGARVRSVDTAGVTP
jgi:hypothetical protein